MMAFFSPKWWMMLGRWVMSQKLDLIISFLSNIKLALNYGSTFPIRFFSTIAIIDSQKIILVKIYSNITYHDASMYQLSRILWPVTKKNHSMPKKNIPPPFVKILGSHCLGHALKSLLKRDESRDLGRRKVGSCHPRTFIE